MLSGVKIILERMKTHPEDFVYGEDRKHRWMRLVDHAISDKILTQEEHEALQAGLRECRREMFNGKVMKVLANEDNQEEERVELASEMPTYMTQPIATLQGGVTPLSSAQIANGAYMNPAQNITASNQMGLSGLFGGIFK